MEYKEEYLPWIEKYRPKKNKKYYRTRKKY